MCNRFLYFVSGYTIIRFIFNVVRFCNIIKILSIVSYIVSIMYCCVEKIHFIIIIITINTYFNLTTGYV